LGINFDININIKSQRLLHEPHIDFTKPWDFFDGAYQGSPKICGDGVILFGANHGTMLGEKIYVRGGLIFPYLHGF
jgi:hypothetical protein